VHAKPPPLTPDALPIARALGANASLMRLQQLLRDSDARFETIRSSLPAPLAAHVRPGPLDAESWSLLAANAAVAAKLRQLQPRLEAAMQRGGWPPVALRIKVVTA
jgi:hypothetical protein